MSTELALLLLRAASALILLTFLAALFMLLWREYRSTSRYVEANRRTYGHLLVIEEIDSKTIFTGERYPLLTLTTLGRASTNTIMVDDSFASNEHAAIMMRDGQWWLEDRHSRNGTTINGTRLEEPVIITDGDIIGIGHKRFRLELQ
ncbi:MAG: FHA domain-containing protein [Chloroflexi bacterium]|nr:MAG: hypothetical protein CUN54_06870 [Phototrophicales bacterium]RMF79119.1 MAG: FHA domain-containing protein [Chloroflexota bacterium]